MSLSFLEIARISKANNNHTMPTDRFMKTEKEIPPTAITTYGKKTYSISRAIARRKVAIPQYQTENINTDDKAQPVQQKK